MSVRPFDWATSRLYFEGTDDEHVVRAIVAKLFPALALPVGGVAGPQGPRNFDIALRNALDAITTSRIARVGLVLDRDGRLDDAGHGLGAGDRWPQISKELESASIGDVPARIPADGLRLLLGERRFGIWLMPDNVSSGALEQFLTDMVPADRSRLLSHATRATAAAIEEHGAEIATKDLPKAELRTFVAWQNTPGLPFGRALTANAFDPSLGAGPLFIDWFKWVFGTDTAP